MDVGDLEHRMFLLFAMYLRKVDEVNNVHSGGESTTPREYSHKYYEEICQLNYVQMRKLSRSAVIIYLFLRVAGGKTPLS